MAAAATAMATLLTRTTIMPSQTLLLLPQLPRKRFNQQPMGGSITSCSRLERRRRTSAASYSAAAAAVCHRYQNSSYYGSSSSKWRRSSSSSSANATTIATPLFYEWIRPNSVVAEMSSSNNDSSSSSSSNPTLRSPIVVLHGLLGNSRNVKSMATKLCNLKQTPVLLLDITGHGKSAGRQPAATVVSVSFADAVTDIHTTIQTALLTAPEPWNITGTAAADGRGATATKPTSTAVTMVGHSLGGRLALYYAAVCAHHPNSNTNTANQHLFPRPDRLWLLDTVPGVADASVMQVLFAAKHVTNTNSSSTNNNHLTTTSTPAAPNKKTMINRNELTAVLQKDHGLNVGTAQWLAAQWDMRQGRFNFDLNVAESLARDFANHDFWDLLDRVLAVGGQTTISTTTNVPIATTTTPVVVLQPMFVHMVQGGANLAWDEDVALRLRHKVQEDTAEATHAPRPPRLTHHILPNAGHWVHVDDLSGLLQAFESVEDW